MSWQRTWSRSLGGPAGHGGIPEYVNVSTAAQVGEQLLGAFDRGAAAVIADMSATALCNRRLRRRGGQRRPAGGGPPGRAAAGGHRACVRRQPAAQGLDRLVRCTPWWRLPSPTGNSTGLISAMIRAVGRGAATATAAERQIGQAPLNQVVLRQMIDALADGIVLADAACAIRAGEPAGGDDLRLPASASSTGQPGGVPMPACGTRTGSTGLPDALSDSPADGLPGPAGRAAQGRHHHPGDDHVSPVPTASEQFVLAAVRDATYEHGGMTSPA